MSVSQPGCGRRSCLGAARHLRHRPPRSTIRQVTTGHRMARAKRQYRRLESTICHVSTGNLMAAYAA
eukprot:2854639-Rhodomonas_salina.1